VCEGGGVIAGWSGGGGGGANGGCRGAMHSGREGQAFGSWRIILELRVGAIQRLCVGIRVFRTSHEEFTQADAVGT
jgi:hypothetical protein